MTTNTDERQRVALQALSGSEHDFRGILGLLRSIESTCQTIVRLTPQLGPVEVVPPPPAVTQMRDDCIRDLAQLLERLAEARGITTTRSKAGLSMRAAISRVDLHPAQQHCVAGRYGGPTFIEALCDLIDSTLTGSIPPLLDYRVSGAFEAHLRRVVGEGRHALPIGAGVALSLTGLLDPDDLAALCGALARECRKIDAMYGPGGSPYGWAASCDDESSRATLPQSLARGPASLADNGAESSAPDASKTGWTIAAHELYGKANEGGMSTDTFGKIRKEAGLDLSLTGHASRHQRFDANQVKRLIAVATNGSYSSGIEACASRWQSRLPE